MALISAVAASHRGEYSETLWIRPCTLRRRRPCRRRFGILAPAPHLQFSLL